MLQLNRPEIVELCGPDARSFAQSQFCNDVNVLEPGCAQLNAWLTAQGRVRVLFHLYQVSAEHFLLMLRGGVANDVAAALKPFVFRSRVTVRASADWTIHAHEGPRPPLDGVWANALGWAVPGRDRWLVLRPGAAPDSVIESDGVDLWTRADIEFGVPTLPPAALDQLLPAWIDLPRLDAISVRKGCYPGQEIVARMHFRGTGAPRRLARIRYYAESWPESDIVKDGTGASLAWLLNRSAAIDSVGEALAVLFPGCPDSTGGVSAMGGARLEVVSTEWND